MEQPAFHLAEYIDTRPEPPPVWVAYPGSDTLRVLIRPLGNREQEFIEKAQQVKWDTAHMARRVVLDQEQYLKLFCAWVVVDWEGMTGADLRRLVLLLDPKAARKIPGPVVCDDGAKMLLMQHSPAFNGWVNHTCRNIERFNQEREEEAEKKRLRPSVSGSTSQASTASSAGKTAERTARSQNAAAVRSAPGAERPRRCWRSITWPAPGATLTSCGSMRRLSIWIYHCINGLCTGGLSWPYIAR